MTTSAAQQIQNPTRRAVLAFLTDVACILLFVALGRRNHGEGVTWAGLTQTAWPFLTGLTATWALSRAWRSPTAVRATGVIVWLGTVTIGMAVRVASGGGIALSFVAVATTFTGALLLGWRAAVAARARRRG